MTKKIISIFIIFSLLALILCSFSLAANNTMNKTKNTIMNAGNTVGNAIVNTKNTITNGVTNIGKDTTMTSNNNSIGSIDGSITGLDTGTYDYTATRTSANANLLGFSSTTWTWMILGIVGIVIVALVLYYGSQYEHTNYDNE